ARGLVSEATKSSSDSEGTNVPSSPWSSTSLVVRAYVRLCRATVCPCRARLRARLRPMTARPVTPMFAVAVGALMAPNLSGSPIAEVVLARALYEQHDDHHVDDADDHAQESADGWRRLAEAGDG